jgi:hypothetical protein
VEADGEAAVRTEELKLQLQRKERWWEWRTTTSDRKAITTGARLFLYFGARTHTTAPARGHEGSGSFFLTRIQGLKDNTWVDWSDLVSCLVFDIFFCFEFLCLFDFWFLFSGSLFASLGFLSIFFPPVTTHPSGFKKNKREELIVDTTLWAFKPID